MNYCQVSKMTLDSQHWSEKRELVAIEYRHKEMNPLSCNVSKPRSSEKELD